MSLKKIIAYGIKEIKYDKDGNTIIKLPPGASRILIQVEKEVGVEDVQMKTILKAIDTLKIVLLEKINENTESIKDITTIVKKNHPEDFK